jgi:hypothetical protein
VGLENTTGEGQIADVTTNNVVRNNNINSYNVDTQHILDFNNTTQNILSVNNKKDGKFYGFLYISGFDCSPFF